MSAVGWIRLIFLPLCRPTNILFVQEIDWNAMLHLGHISKSPPVVPRIGRVVSGKILSPPLLESHIQLTL